jgi:hypothetical protein
MAAARVVLLVLCVVLFAVMWSGDRPAPAPPQMIAADDVSVLELEAALTGLAEDADEGEHVSRSDEHVPRPAESAAMFPAEWQAAVPYGVTPGDYLFVDATTGQAMRLEITAELLQTWGQDPHQRGEPHYTLTMGARRAYLVRLSPAGLMERMAGADTRTIR